MGLVQLCYYVKRYIANAPFGHSTLTLSPYQNISLPLHFISSIHLLSFSFILPQRLILISFAFSTFKHDKGPFWYPHWLFMVIWPTKIIFIWFVSLILLFCSPLLIFIIIFIFSSRPICILLFTTFHDFFYVNFNFIFFLFSFSDICVTLKLYNYSLDEIISCPYCMYYHDTICTLDTPTTTHLFHLSLFDITTAPACYHQFAHWCILQIKVYLDLTLAFILILPPSIRTS